jgi:hypothetical protein
LKILKTAQSTICLTWHHRRGPFRPQVDMPFCQWGTSKKCRVHIDPTANKKTTSVPASC